VDCDVPTDGGSELKILIMTAVPGSADETKLQLAAVAGSPDTTNSSRTRRQAREEPPATGDSYQPQVKRSQLPLGNVPRGHRRHGHNGRCTLQETVDGAVEPCDRFSGGMGVEVFSRSPLFNEDQ